MAELYPCQDCGRLVSRHADACPYCGRPDPAGKAMQDNIVGLLFLILVVVVLFALLIAGFAVAYWLELLD